MAAAITSSPTSPRALLGPLTKLYTPPQICLTFAQASYGPTAWAAQGCSSGTPVDTSSCWPPAFVSAPAPPYYGWGFYSPGLICPSGYSSACSTALEKSGSSPSSFAQPFSFQFPLVPGETAVGCCPTSFSCALDTDGVQTCTSSVTDGSYIAGICQASANALTDFQYITVPATNLVTFASSVTEITATTAYLQAPLFQINWQSADRPISTTSSSTSSTLTTPSSVSTTSPSGLSTGVIAAIAVIVPVVILAFIGLILCWWFRGRKKHPAPAESRPIEISGGEPTDFPLMEMAGGEKYFQSSELDAVPQRQELEAERQGLVRSGYTPVPQELSASAL